MEGDRCVFMRKRVKRQRWGARRGASVHTRCSIKSVWGGFRDHKLENALAEVLYILACKQNDGGKKTYKRKQATASIVFPRPTRRKTWPANERSQQ